MAVKLSGSLPNDVDRNGMYRIHTDLVDKPSRRHLVVMVVDCVRTAIEHGDEDEFTPTMGALFIEPITDRDDKVAIIEAMARHRAERTGNATIDFDFGVGDPLAETMQKMREDGVHVSFSTGEAQS